ncbi:MAG: hypothetical protein ACE5KZ_00180 [Candidatus Scalinduaceae bacterium]
MEHIEKYQENLYFIVLVRLTYRRVIACSFRSSKSFVVDQCIHTTTNSNIDDTNTSIMPIFAIINSKLLSVVVIKIAKTAIIIELNDNKEADLPSSIERQSYR